jgi:hypothetical protein
MKLMNSVIDESTIDSAKRLLCKISHSTIDNVILQTDINGNICFYVECDSSFEIENEDEADKKLDAIQKIIPYDPENKMLFIFLTRRGVVVHSWIGHP